MIPEQGRGHIHGDADGMALLAPAESVLERLLQHMDRQVAGAAMFLDERNEAVGSDRPALGMHPPHQGLDPHNLAGTDIQLRLIGIPRSEEHTSELQSLMLNSYAVFCLKTKKKKLKYTKKLY